MKPIESLRGPFHHGIGKRKTTLKALHFHKQAPVSFLIVLSTLFRL